MTRNVCRRRFDRCVPLLGLSVGVMLGRFDGVFDGTYEGPSVGANDGKVVGRREGLLVGSSVGVREGTWEGKNVGLPVHLAVVAMALFRRGRRITRHKLSGMSMDWAGSSECQCRRSMAITVSAARAAELRKPWQAGSIRGESPCQRLSGAPRVDLPFITRPSPLPSPRWKAI